MKTSIENFARKRGVSVVDAMIEDEAFANARLAMCPEDKG